MTTNYSDRNRIWQEHAKQANAGGATKRIDIASTKGKELKEKLPVGKNDKAAKRVVVLHLGPRRPARSPARRSTDRAVRGASDDTG